MYSTLKLYANGARILYFDSFSKVLLVHISNTDLLPVLLF